MKLRLRPATWDDGRTLFEWANDPTTRSHSFSSDPIAWETHVKWFERRLGDPDGTRIFVAERSDRVPVGQIRFDRNGSDAEIGFSVAPEHRGRGYGKRLLELGRRRIVAVWRDVECVVGFVKPENVASARAFASLGFDRSAAPENRLEFRWTRQDQRFVVAGPRQVADAVVARVEAATPGTVEPVHDPADLARDRLETVLPGFVFLLQPSWAVAQDVCERFDCVSFHVRTAGGEGRRAAADLAGCEGADAELTATWVESPEGAGRPLTSRVVAIAGSEDETLERAIRALGEMIVDIVATDGAGRDGDES